MYDESKAGIADLRYKKAKLLIKRDRLVNESESLRMEIEELRAQQHNEKSLGTESHKQFNLGDDQPQTSLFDQMNKMLGDTIALIKKNDAVDVIKSSKRHYKLEVAANGVLLRAIEH